MTQARVADTFRIQIADADVLRQLESEAVPELQEHFDLIKEGLVAIPGVPAEAFYSAVTLRALALKPDIFYSWFLTEYHSVKRGEIPSHIKELLAVIVSYINEEEENAACAPYHAGAARFEGASEEEIRSVLAYESGSNALDEEARTVIDFGIKAAYHPKEVTDADVEAVKALGYSDAAIVELVSASLIAYNLSALNQVLNLREGAG